jgi:nucleoside 2-deoxyribosyltransferase
LSRTSIKKSKLIYIAGPLFSEHERDYLLKIEEKIYQELGWKNEFEELENTTDGLKKNSICFIPHRDAGDLGISDFNRDNIFQADLNALDNSVIIIAILDGPDVDSGTAVELGYAYAKGKKIVGLLTDKRHLKSEENMRDEETRIYRLNNMVWGVCHYNGYICYSLKGLISEIKNFLNSYKTIS